MSKINLIIVFIVFSFQIFGQESDVITGASIKILSGIKRDGTKLNAFIMDNSVKQAEQLRSILISEGFRVIDMAKDDKPGFEAYKKENEEIDIIFLGSENDENRDLEILNEILKQNIKTSVIMIVNKKYEAYGQLNTNKLIKGYLTVPLSNSKVRKDLRIILNP